MANKNQVLADIQDLVLTLHRKSKELKEDANLRRLWLEKNNRLKAAVELLTADEMAGLDKEYSEWFRREFPHVPPVASTQIPQF